YDRAAPHNPPGTTQPLRRLRSGGPGAAPPGTGREGAAGGETPRPPTAYASRVSENSQPPPFGPATGIGSLPGGDVREAAKTVTGSFEDFPHIPELPARGPGADMIGRTA